MSLSTCPVRTWRATALVATVVVASLAFIESARGQLINQQVGGVSIDAQGIVRKVRIDELGELQRVRQQAFQQVPGDLKTAALRKISLRKLEAAIAEQRDSGAPLSDEMRYLAGLQRIQYIFVYPEQGDIVLAGPGEGWRISPDGEIVGESTNQPVMLLDHLLVALRAIEAIKQTGINCSIDPTPEGLARYQALMKTAGPVGGNPNPIMEAIAKSLGPQMISVSGVPATSHFARVLVAADYRMKRLAMAFDEPPIQGLPDFLHLIKTSRGVRGSAMQRWWLTPDYGALLADPDGTAWELTKAGVKVMTEDEYVDASGGRTGRGQSNPLAKKWADNFTAHYEELSAKDSVFGQLRNCMDLAVVAALVAQQNLTETCNWNLGLLLNPELPVESYHAPRQVDTQSSVVQKGDNWIISASGGVQINPWQILETPTPGPKLGEARAKAAPTATTWWWN